MTKAIAKKQLLSYGILAAPLAFAGIPLYIHAPDFYATQYGLSLASIGIALLLLRFIDAVQDPIIGYYSDKYAKYRPKIILLASITLVVSFALLFKPMIDHYLIWFSLLILMATTSFSILTINLNSLGGLWVKDNHQKTMIAGYRESFGLIGLILAVMLPSILQSQMPLEQAFLYVSLILALLSIIAVYIFSKWQKNHSDLNYSIPTSPQATLWRWQSISNRTKVFLLIYGISILASSIPAVLVLFFIRDRLNLENYTGLFLLAYFLSGAIGIAIWNTISRHIGKYKAWMFAMLLAIISFIWAYFLGAGDFWSYLLICLLSGIAFGAELVLPASILADHIQDENQQHKSAFHFGIMAFLAKLALALAAAVTLPFLEAQGFMAGRDNSPEALYALTISYAIIPCFIKLISTLILWRFINEEKNISNRNRSIDYA